MGVVFNLDFTPRTLVKPSLVQECSGAGYAGKGRVLLMEDVAVRTKSVDKEKRAV